MEDEKCNICGSRKNLKRGWCNNWYCSEGCERMGVSRLHGSMPGCNKPWIPGHISIEIERRWAE